MFPDFVILGSLISLISTSGRYCMNLDWSFFLFLSLITIYSAPVLFPFLEFISKELKTVYSAWSTLAGTSTGQNKPAIATFSR